MLLLGFAGGLRRSEVVGLDCGRDQTEDSSGWVEILDLGLLLRLRGKTGWREVEIGRGSADATCPVVALQTWLKLARIAHGPLFRRVTGHGKTKRRWQNTVVCLRFDGPELPRFVLSPESVWHKVGAWFGAQDIDFEHHEAFSSRYILRGENEPAIRELFNDGVLDFYARNPGLTTEGMSHTLLHYRHNQCVPSDQLRSFLSEALEVLSLYRSHDFSGGGHAAPKNTASSPRE